MAINCKKSIIYTTVKVLILPPKYNNYEKKPFCTTTFYDVCQQPVGVGHS